MHAMVTVAKRVSRHSPVTASMHEVAKVSEQTMPTTAVDASESRVAISFQASAVWKAGDEKLNAAFASAVNASQAS